jgi:hypothetical protein
MYIGFFYNTSGNNYTCRSAFTVDVWDGTPGYMYWWKTSFDCRVGDYIGYYIVTGRMNDIYPGHVYAMSYTGNACSDNQSTTFSNWYIMQPSLGGAYPYD